jgi:zinc resistance-associated protein
MKRALTIIGIVLLMAAIAAPVVAQGPGLGRGRMMQGDGPGEPGTGPRWGWDDKLTDEQRTQLDKLHQKFFDDTAAMRSQMAAKRSELHILMNTSNPDFEKAKALQKEISDLRGKMGQERIKLFAEERKINPEARYGMGWGRGGKRAAVLGAAAWVMEEAWDAVSEADPAGTRYDKEERIQNPLLLISFTSLFPGSFS